MHAVLPLVSYCNINCDIFSGSACEYGIRGNLEMTWLAAIPLLQFDLSALSGARILSGKLRMHVSGQECPRQVELSAITHPWQEDALLGFCAPGVPWGNGREWMTDFIHGLHHAPWCVGDVDWDTTTLWAEVPLSVQVLQALALRHGTGLALIDSMSKVWRGEENRCDKYFDTDGEWAPCLEIEYQPAGATVVPDVSDISITTQANLENFEDALAQVSFRCPGAPQPARFIVEYGQAGQALRQAYPGCVPLCDGRSGAYTAQLFGLKPDADYRVAIRVRALEGLSGGVEAAFHTAQAQP
nr:hypothetical protein [bacterium]